MATRGNFLIETSLGSAEPALIHDPELAPTADGKASTSLGTARSAMATVLAVRHWTESLLSFRVSRMPGFRFTPGHYARLGLVGLDRSAVWRPFSIVSAAHDPYLEFFAVLVPGGAFSDALSAIREGDSMRIENNSYGFMTVDRFVPGEDLWLLASGTGLGPFLSILHDPHTWQCYRDLVLVHSVRHARDLAYREEIAAIAQKASTIASGARFAYVPVVTRERCAGALPSRIPCLIEDGRLQSSAGSSLDPRRSRIMVCGNPEMARELRALLTARGFRANRRGQPGELAFENYWQPAPLRT